LSTSSKKTSRNTESDRRANAPEDINLQGRHATPGRKHMLFETDTTTQQVMTMYGIWFAFITTLVVILFKGNSNKKS
jgi:hypothetical protein